MGTAGLLPALLFWRPSAEQQAEMDEEDRQAILQAGNVVSEALQEAVGKVYSESGNFVTIIELLKTTFDNYLDDLALAEENSSHCGEHRSAMKTYWQDPTDLGISWLSGNPPPWSNIDGRPRWFRFGGTIMQTQLYNDMANNASTPAPDNLLEHDAIRRSTFAYSLAPVARDYTNPPENRLPLYALDPAVPRIDNAVPGAGTPAGLASLDPNYPHLWAYWVAIMHYMVQRLCEQLSSDSFPSGDGRANQSTGGKSWSQEAVDELAASAMTNPGGTMQGILRLNHGGEQGILGIHGGADSGQIRGTQASHCALLNAGTGSNPPFTAFYHNKTSIYPTSAPDEPLLALCGTAYGSIQSVLRSGGGWMGTPEIGAFDTESTEISREKPNRHGWTDVRENDTRFGEYSGADHGVWSLRSICRRVKKSADMLKNGGYIGTGDAADAYYNALHGGASIIETFAARLLDSSNKLVEIQREYMKVICEQKLAVKDLGGRHENLFEDFLDRWAGLEDEAVSAQNALGSMSTVNPGIADAQLNIFRHQCFLLSFVQSLSIYKRDFVDQKYTDIDDDTNNMYKKINKRLPYMAVPDISANENSEHNACLMLDGNPYAFMNALTVNPDLKYLQNAKPHELSNIQPYIRLYKVIFDDEGTEHEVEISFESHFSEDEMDLFRDAKNRGVGAGLKSFNFTYDGSNPFAVKKSIKANLKIFANSFKELHRTRTSHAGDEYSYLDLAMKTWNTAPASVPSSADAANCFPTMDLFTENVINSELNFRLKAVVGLSVPAGSPGSISADVLRALKESYVTLNLTPTVHNFDFDEMGRVTFNLNFLAYAEQFFDTNVFNVFSDVNITKARLAREFKIKEYQRTCDREQVDIVKDEFSEVVNGEIEQSLSALFTDMIASDLIYSINIPNDVLSNFLMRGPFGTYDDLEENFSFGGLTSYNNPFQMSGIIPSANTSTQNGNLQEMLNEAMSTAGAAYSDDNIDDADAPATARNRVAAALFVDNPDFTTIEYFYLSDLVDKILMRIGQELKELGEDNALDELIGDPAIQCEDVKAKASIYKKAAGSFEKMRVLLGPVEFTNPNYDESNPHVVVNLGDMPISVKYFAEWLTNVMFKKDEVFYPLTRFLNDLINGLVKDFLNDSSCFGYNIKQKARLQQATISGFSPERTNAAGESGQYDIITGRLIDLSDRAKYAANELATQGSTCVDSGVSTCAKQTGKSYAFRAHMEDFPAYDPDDGERLRPILNTSGPPGSARNTAPLSQLYNYLVYFVGRVMPNERMLGNKTMDENAGIFHYTLGRDRGTLKNIKLTKTQTKGLAEVRFEQDGYDGLQQLRVIYDAQVDMFSNVQAFPGQYIFIDPRGFAPDMPLGLGRDDFGMTKLGVGGYYMIVRSEHEFGPGYANSILHTKWVNQIDSEADEGVDGDNLSLSSTGDGGTVPRACLLPTPPEDDSDIADPAL